MKERDDTISEFDYEQLPPALRRKYFSSLERLRLAQDGACPIYHSRLLQEPQRPLTSSNASSFSTRRSIRRPSTALEDYLQTSSQPTRNKLRKHSRVVSVTPSQVAHFASLPPALQRKHFSREEQVLLASRINHIILDAADEAIYKQYGRTSRLPTSIEESSTTSSDLDESETDDMELSEDELSSLRWLDEEEGDLDLSLYDYHAAVTETTRKSRSSTQRHSFRRGLLASNVSLSRRSSSIYSLPGQAGWPLPAATSQSSSNLQRSAYASSTLGHRKNRTSTSSLDPSAAHYQDPAARMKLRVYLASPQKFDEALEFGFPSVQEPTTKRSARPIVSLRSTDSNVQGFVNDDTPSLSDGDDHDIEALDSPRTPQTSAFSSTFSKSKESSLDRTSIKPKIVRDMTDSYVHALSSNREMTLRMTLTRPDLRSPEETSSTHINSRPLEQAPLHFSDDIAGFWDSLPDNESKVKKLFKKLKLRS